MRLRELKPDSPLEDVEDGVRHFVSHLLREDYPDVVELHGPMRRAATAAAVEAFKNYRPDATRMDRHGAEVKNASLGGRLAYVIRETLRRPVYGPPEALQAPEAQ